MKPKLSIGIPTFNQGQYLEKAILSVLNQTVKPYEFIICNNHSNDGLTDEVLSKYYGKIKIITPPHHLGLMENFDYLAKRMTGDWITFTCSDDYFETNFVQTFYENINKNAVIHRFGINWIDENDNITRSNKLRSVRKTQKFPGNFYEQLSGSKGTFGATVMRMDALRKVGFFDKNLKLNGDWGLYLKLSTLGEFEYIDLIGGNVRLNYRPTLPMDRFQDDISDIFYIYGVIQKEIIEKFNLNKKRYNNALKLRLYLKEQFMKENNLESFEAFEKFKALVPEPHIKNKKEYLIKNYYQRFYEMFLKK